MTDAWSPDDMPSFVGKRAVVTGANSGIGYYTALELARRGAEVTLAVRTPDKGEKAAERINAELSTMEEAGSVRVAQLDLGAQDSVAQFAESWAGKLDVLINNAGVMTPPRYTESKDGQELQFATNHLGHYALTGRLMPNLLEANDPRVVTVSSIAHHGGDGTVVDGNPRQGYSPQKAYSNSKLANLLFAAHLQRLSPAQLTSVAAHPGVSATGLVTSEQGLGSLKLVRAVAPLATKVLFQSARRGAEPSLYAASLATPPNYSGPQKLRESRGEAGPAKLSTFARDEVLAARLWEVSANLTGVDYTFA